MKKRLICAALAAVMLFGFSACSKKTKYALTVGDEGVSSGVLAYYIDRIIASPKSFGLKEKSDEAVIEKAVDICCEIVSAQKLMKDNSIALQLQYKTDVAQKTENMWNLFGEHYKASGTEKSDLTTINTYEAQKKQLVQYYYGSSGKKPVSDDKLKQKFVEMYIGFKGFEGSFTKQNAKGETVDMTEKEREELISKFRKMAQKVNEGASIDDVYSQYCTTQGLVATSELQVDLVRKNDPMYADDFYSKVSTISHGKAAPVTSGSSVYVVLRTTIATSDDDAFEAYREEVLDEIKMPSIEKKISETAKKLEIKKDERRLEEIYKAVEKANSK